MRTSRRPILPGSPPGVRRGTIPEARPVVAGALSRKTRSHDQGPGDRRVLLDRPGLAAFVAPRLVAAAARLGSPRRSKAEQKDPRPARVAPLRIGIPGGCQCVCAV